MYPDAEVPGTQLWESLSPNRENWHTLDDNCGPQSCFLSAGRITGASAGDHPSIAAACFHRFWEGDGVIWNLSSRFRVKSLQVRSSHRRRSALWRSLPQ